MPSQSLKDEWKSTESEHHVTTGFNVHTGCLQHLRWRNAAGQLDAPGDLPAELYFTPGGVIRNAWWWRAGKRHRDGDLPARIDFDELGRPENFEWYKNGIEHRDGDRPASIAFRDGTLSMPVQIEWYVGGERLRPGHEIDHYSFDEKGNSGHEDGFTDYEFPGFEPGWLPVPTPTLVMPHPLLLNLPVRAP